MSEGLREIEEFKRSLLKKLLSQCNEKQVDFFNRLYGSVEEIPERMILNAIRQIERTIEKNLLKKDSD